LRRANPGPTASTAPTRRFARWHGGCYRFSTAGRAAGDVSKLSSDAHTPRPDDFSALRPATPPTDVAFDRWARSIERKRRLLWREQWSAGRRPSKCWPTWLACAATRASFGLEGIAVTDADLAEALIPGRALRSRRARRLRRHLAIFRAMDRRPCPLTPQAVVRWYTSVADGLSVAAITPAAADRLAGVVRRINSPQMRLQPAVLETARLHCELLADTLFPGFNGILARLLLHAHLANCGLPPVVFDPARDAWRRPTPVTVANRLLEMIDASLERLAQ
jgi:hypothetical protein